MDNKIVYSAYREIYDGKNVLYSECEKKAEILLNETIKKYLPISIGDHVFIIVDMEIKRIKVSRIKMGPSNLLVTYNISPRTEGYEIMEKVYITFEEANEARNNKIDILISRQDDEILRLKAMKK